MCELHDPGKLVADDLELALAGTVVAGPENSASRRTCELLGAELVEVVAVPEGTLLCAGSRLGVAIIAGRMFNLVPLAMTGNRAARDLALCQTLYGLADINQVT